MLSYFRRNPVSLVLVAVGLVVLTMTSVIFLIEASVAYPADPQNGVLSVRLGVLVGIGWLPIGIAIGLRVIGKSRYRILLSSMLGIVLGAVMGLLGWIFTFGIFTFS